MKKILSVLALSFLLMGTGSVMAQKKGKDAGKNAPRTPNKEMSPKKAKTSNVSRESLFVGTIEYDVYEEDTKVLSHENVVAETKSVEVRPKEVSLIKKEKKSSNQTSRPEKNHAYYYYTERGTFAFFNIFALAYSEKIPTVMAVFPNEDETIIAENKEDNEKIRGLFAESGLKRTNETKEIAGIKATRYLYSIPDMEGELWLAESYTLNYEAVPFPKVQHPILEGDVFMLMDGKPILKFHLVARRIEKEVDVKVIDRIFSGVFMELPEVKGRLMEMIGK